MEYVFNNVFSLAGLTTLTINYFPTEASILFLVLKTNPNISSYLENL